MYIHSESFVMNIHEDVNSIQLVNYYSLTLRVPDYMSHVKFINPRSASQTTYRSHVKFASKWCNFSHHDRTAGGRFRIWPWPTSCYRHSLLESHQLVGSSRQPMGLDCHRMSASVPCPNNSTLRMFNPLIVGWQKIVRAIIRGHCIIIVKSAIGSWVGGLSPSSYHVDKITPTRLIIVTKWWVGGSINGRFWQLRNYAMCHGT